MRTAFRLRHNVVDGEVLKREGDAASVAEALLLAEERVLVRFVVGQLAHVGALGYVLAVNEVVKERSLRLYALPYQLCRERLQVDACPLAIEAVGGYTCCSTAAERV